MPRILVAEDDDSTRELVKHILSGAGFQVETAADGQAALDAVAKAPPDLIVLDIMLPEVHGYSVCRQVKTAQKSKDTKILMLSAKTFPADRRQAEAVGADAFMGKPVNPGDLVNKVKSLLA